MVGLYWVLIDLCWVLVGLYWVLISLCWVILIGLRLVLFLVEP